MANRMLHLKRNDNESMLLKDFTEFLQVGTFCDVSLAVEGVSLKCHKIVLAAFSPYFHNVLLENTCQDPLVFLEDVSLRQARTLLDFMYRGLISVRKEEVEELMRVAESLQVEGLLKHRAGLEAVSSVSSDPPGAHSDHSYSYQWDHNYHSPLTDSPNSRQISRTQFSPPQLEVLQKHFSENNYCDPGKLQYLSELLDLSPRVIQVWFQNSRRKKIRTRKRKQKQSSVESAQSQYLCQNCLDQFPTYLDLIIHQVRPCFEEEEEEDKIINTVDYDDWEQYQSGGSTGSDSEPADQIALPAQLEQLMEQFEQFSEKNKQDQLTSEDLTVMDENENSKQKDGGRVSEENSNPVSQVIDEERKEQDSSAPQLRIVDVKTLMPAEWNTEEDSQSATEEVQHGELVLDYRCEWCGGTFHHQATLTTHLRYECGNPAPLRELCGRK